MTEGAYEIICQSCRAAVPSSASTCPRCGHNLLAGTVQPPPLASQAALFGATTIPAPLAPTAMPSFHADTAYDRLGYTTAQR